MHITKTLQTSGCSAFPLSLILIITMLFATRTAQAAYNPADEFSITNNTIGVWSYGFAMGRVDSFTRFPFYDTWSFNSKVKVGAWRRNLPFPANYPLVMKNLDQTDLNRNNNGDILMPARTLAVSPGDSPNPTYGIVRFTSPKDGLYSIQAIFSGISFSGPRGGTTVDVHILVNGSSVFDSSISSFGETRGYASSALVRLSAGATVDFAVGPGGNDQNSDYTGLAAIITPDSHPNPPLLMVLPVDRLRFSHTQGLRIPVIAPVNGSFRIETSTDLSNWSPLASFQSSPGSFEFIDATAVTFKSRFYRAVKP